jgi:hypothetical protein
MSERTPAQVAEQRRRICQVPCTQCGATAGGSCRTPRGVPAPPHGKRRADAAAAGVWVPGAVEQPS